jgi:hypothetical protein
MSISRVRLMTPPFVVRSITEVIDRRGSLLLEELDGQLREFFNRSSAGPKSS